MKRVHAGETLGTGAAGMRCELSRSGMGGACNVVSIDMNEKGCYVHSGSTIVLSIGRNITKRYFGIVFVFQRGRPAIVSVVIWFVFELQLRFGNVRGVLECRIQTSAWGVCFCLGGFRGGQQARSGDSIVHTPVSVVFGLIEIMGALLCP